VSEASIVADGKGLSIRPIGERDDYDLLLAWLNLAHVAQWWNPEQASLSLESLMADYPRESPPDDPTSNGIIEIDHRPIGFIQFYPWDAYPDEVRELGFAMPDGYWGVDLFIGELDQVNRGYGSRLVALLGEYLRSERRAAGIALVVAMDNSRAQRAYEKAGLTRIAEVLDTDTRDGVRIPSYVMATPR
jgi:aminoglycoside 6'-N-acetyltransferase